jgi:hypothetical protein
MAVPSLLGFLNLHEMGLNLAPDFEEFVEKLGVSILYQDCHFLLPI